MKEMREGTTHGFGKFIGDDWVTREVMLFFQETNTLEAESNPNDANCIGEFKDNLRHCHGKLALPSLIIFFWRLQRRNWLYEDIRISLHRRSLKILDVRLEQVRMWPRRSYTRKLRTKLDVWKSKTNLWKWRKLKKSLEKANGLCLQKNQRRQIFKGMHIMLRALWCWTCTLSNFTIEAYIDSFNCGWYFQKISNPRKFFYLTRCKSQILAYAVWQG